MAYTLVQLRNLSRMRADMVNSDFVDDDEVTQYINASLAELHDVIVNTFDDYVSKSTTFTLTSSNVYTLPSDLLKVRMVSIQDGTRYVPLRALPLAERWRYTGSTAYSRGYDRRYVLMGPSLTVYPAERAGGTYELVYVQQYVPISSDLEVPFSGTGVPDQYWTEYAIVDTAIKLLQKEESDVSVLMAQKAALKKRITDAAAMRDSGEPSRILDIDGDTPQWPWWAR